MSSQKKKRWLSVCSENPDFGLYLYADSMQYKYAYLYLWTVASIACLLDLSEHEMILFPLFSYVALHFNRTLCCVLFLFSFPLHNVVDKHQSSSRLFTLSRVKTGKEKTIKNSRH